MAGRLNPFIKLLVVMLFSIAVSRMQGWLPLLVLAAVLFLPLLFHRNLFKTLWKMKVMLITAFLIYIFRLANVGEQLSALSATARFLSTIAAAALYIATTDLTELSAAIGSFFGKAIGKAAWRFASGVMMTIALFPIIFEAATEMLDARKARGGSFLAHPIQNLTDYTVSLMRILFQKILIFQDAMYARAYTEEAERTAPLYHPFDFGILLCAVLFLLLTLLF